MQLDGRRRRVCGLYHRQRRQQSDRAADVGRGGRHASGWRRISISSRCSIWPARCWCTSPFRSVKPMQAMPAAQSPFAAMIAHWRNPSLRAAFAIGFCILFAFIGTFTFVNFVLVRAPLSLGRMDLGFVYFVFAPSVVTTLFAGKAVARFGTRPVIWGALAVAAIGLPLMLSSHLAARAGRHGAGRRRHFLRAGRPRPALSARPRTTTAASPAGPISPATSSAAWSAAPCSDNCSTVSAGPPASPVSARRWRWRRC